MISPAFPVALPAVLQPARPLPQAGPPVVTGLHTGGFVGQRHVRISAADVHVHAGVNRGTTGEQSEIRKLED